MSDDNAGYGGCCGCLSGCGCLLVLMALATGILVFCGALTLRVLRCYPPPAAAIESAAGAE